jgi:hypothetical protein
MRYAKAKILLVSTLLLASTTLLAPPAEAIVCNMQLNITAPGLNSNHNPLFKAQMKITIAGCTVDWIKVVVCAGFWDGNSREPLGSCVDSGQVHGVTQVTRNKTLVGGCAPNLPYITRARGQFRDGTVVYNIPPQFGSFAFNPPNGGRVLC